MEKKIRLDRVCHACGEETQVSPHLMLKEQMFCKECAMDEKDDDLEGDCGYCGELVSMCDCPGQMIRQINQELHNLHNLALCLTMVMTHPLNERLEGMPMTSIVDGLLFNICELGRRIDEHERKYTG